jgi:hypothetical protein
MRQLKQQEKTRCFLSFTECIYRANNYLLFTEVYKLKETFQKIKIYHQKLKEFNDYSYFLLDNR